MAQNRRQGVKEPFCAPKARMWPHSTRFARHGPLFAFYIPRKLFIGISFAQKFIIFHDPVVVIDQQPLADLGRHGMILTHNRHHAEPD